MSQGLISLKAWALNWIWYFFWKGLVFLSTSGQQRHQAVNRGKECSYAGEEWSFYSNIIFKPNPPTPPPFFRKHFIKLINVILIYPYYPYLYYHLTDHVSSKSSVFLRENKYKQSFLFVFEYCCVLTLFDKRINNIKTR